MHRDLKPENILLSRDSSRVCVGDFGLAKPLQFPVRDLTREIQVLARVGLIKTVGYRAPELLLGIEHYSFAVDIWSLGCILAEILLGSLTREETLRGVDRNWESFRDIQAAGDSRRVALFGQVALFQLRVSEI